LVPRSSAFGAAEVKRSNYSGVDAKLEEFLREAPALIATLQAREVGPRYIGVIGVIEQTPSERLQKLLDDGSVVALFDKTGPEVVLRAKDVLRFINFLHRVARCYQREVTSGPLLELRTDF
jgi:hypothetical protein